jgi:hypothetical protein
MADMKRLSIDAFFDEQSKAKSKVLATLDQEAANATVVKVTPWVEGKGCLCKLSLELPKSAIEAVVQTAHSHRCCNKVHTVVEVLFKKDATILLDELFHQLVEAAASNQADAHAMSRPRLSSAFSQIHRFPPFPSFPRHISPLSIGVSPYQQALNQMPAPTPSTRGQTGVSPLFEWWNPFDWWDAYQTWKKAKCLAEKEYCLSNCWDNDDPTQCNADCDNAYRRCTGVGVQTLPPIGYE